MPLLILRRATVVALVACFTLVGCSGRTADESFAAAKSHLAKNDLASAIVELKNTLQGKPDFAEARYMLGKALLQREDPLGAALELEKAISLKYPADQAAPLLAAAYLGSGQARKVVDLDAGSTLAAANAVAELKTQLARAHRALGNPERAEAALVQALQANAQFGPALLLRASGLAAQREFDAALRGADEVLARAPADVDALTFKANVLRAKLDAPAATALYRQALVAKPDHIPAHIGLLSQSLAKNDLETARLQLAELKKTRPTHPQTKYFEARLAAQSGDAKLALELTQQLLKLASEDPQVLELAGVVAYQRGDMALAEQHLGKLLHVVPEHANGRQLLARLYLRKGDPAKAQQILRPLIEAASADANSLSIAGAAYLQSGDPRRAEEVFTRAAKLKPADARNLAAVGLAKIATGAADAGLIDLEASAAADAGTDADMALISAHLNRRNYAAALEAIGRLESKQPGKALPQFLRGDVLARRGDSKDARAAYERALAAEPVYFPALGGLAALDLRERKPAQARARFEAVLKDNPSHARAILALALLDERAGKPKQEVAATLAKGVSLAPNDAMLRRRQIEFELLKQDHKLALAAAQDAVAALPNDIDILTLLAKAQQVSGETNQAIISYTKVVAARPSSPGPLVALAEAHLATKAYDAAAAAVSRALVLAPESVDVMQAAVKVDVLAGNYDKALAHARALQARTPKAPQGWLFEGDVEVARRNWPAAAAALRTALQKQDSTLTAQRLHRVLRSAGDRAKTDAFAAEWLTRHPQDPAFLFHLAGLAIAEKNFGQAATRLEEILRKTPESPAALNNLAWVHATLKKPGAVANAERANQLIPNQPIFMDTLAYALAAEGQIARAVEIQKKALELAPSAHVLRLNMARLYLQAGDKAGARAELDTLAMLGNQFAQQNEVRELQGKL